ncbi:MAG: beta-phosphoglucomutase [Clostridiales bacterium]|jgi:beta-phosphoglucomutase|nr:beta-phosphoglucomutase [Clostridiales bacterium]
MRYRGIIFDLDGVIVHTDRYHYKAWKALADRLGIYFDEEINNRLRGVSRMESLDIILERAETVYSDAEKVGLAAEKNAEYQKLLEQMSPADISPEVLGTLGALKARGIRLAIGSSSKNAGLILARTGIRGLFDAVSDGNNITRSKPDPEVFALGAEYIRLSPEDCLVVEDAIAGIDAAVAGGFDSAALGEAAGYAKATYTLARFGDLLELCPG